MTPSQALLAFTLLAGCTARALDVPEPDVGIADLSMSDGIAIRPADLAAMDAATQDWPVAVDLAQASVDLSDPFPPDSGGAPVPPVQRLVYAHSATVLYTIDPGSLAVTEVGPFLWPTGATDSMTDIAIDRHGDMIGVSWSSVYTIDPATARCTRLAYLEVVSMNALSFVASRDPAQGEVLVGAVGDTLYRVDPSTGAQTIVGSWNEAWTSSGDLVSIDGATYATVNDGGIDDLLVRIDPMTAAATEVGRTGVSQIWGLGYWDGQLYGFTELDGIVLIDAATGSATRLAGTASISYWGAGVVTTAPTQ